MVPDCDAPEMLFLQIPVKGRSREGDQSVIIVIRERGVAAVGGGWEQGTYFTSGE